MQVVAQGALVYKLTQSEFWLGVVSCAAGLPSLLFSPFAGVLVERLPRHKILMITQTIQMILAFILAALAFAEMVQVWHIMVLAFIGGCVNAVDAPARQALVSTLVDKEHLTSGISLSATMYNASRVFGPTAAGIALVTLGTAWCFFINGLSFLAVLFSLFLLRVNSSPVEIGAFNPLHQLREGLLFSARHPTIAPILLLATIGSVFSLNVWTLLPAFAHTALNSGDAGYAQLSTFNGIGAVFAALLVTRIGSKYGRGRVIAGMALFTPFALAALGLQTVLIGGLFFTLIAGFGLILQFVTMNTLIQSEVPDQFRARVLSLYTLTFFGIAPFGALGLGLLAEQIGSSGAILFCSVTCLALNIITLRKSPQLLERP